MQPTSSVSTPARPQQHTYKSVLGRGSVLPNLYWTALPPAQLRQYHSNYVGLPSDCVITTPETYRYVRQHTDLWKDLHAGRLTTGKLNAALGLQEPGSARAVGAPENPGAVVGAYTNLTAPTWQPPSSVQRTDAVAHNEAERAKLYQNKLPLASLPAGGLWDGGSPGSGDLAKRRVCEQVGLGGELSCRLHWGSVQEASALDALGQIFSHSVIEEVGVMSLDLGSLPAAWGVSESEMPPVGASPDALIRHSLPVTQDQISQARQTLGLSNHPSPSSGPHSVPATPVTPELRNQASQLARQLIMTALDSLVTPADQVAADAPPDAQGTGAGAAAAAPPSKPPTPPVLPLTHTNEESLQQLTNIILQPPAANNNHVPDNAQPPQLTTDSQGTVWVPWREVVEVKNHCPFTMATHRKARHGRTMLQYSVRESGPFQRLRGSWLPQLQWHCLNAGTHSALLVSRSPSKGVTVFRVHRDDDYLMLAVRLIRHTHVMYSARGLAPPKDVMKQPEWRFEHQAVVAATRQLATNSPVLVSWPGEHQVGRSEGVAMGARACRRRGRNC